MASIDKRQTQGGKVHYRVRVRLRGYTLQTATFERKTDAKRWAQQTEAAIRERRHFKTAEAKRHTLEELLDRYVAEVAPLTQGQGVRQQKQRHARWWKQQIGAFTLADVTPALIAECRDRLAKRGGVGANPASPATQNRYLATLSHALTLAVREWEWLDDNPCRKVRRPSEPRGRVRFLTDEERESLLKTCQQGKDPRLYPLVVLALSTGARKGELLQLRWPDVDLQRGLAVIHDTKNRERRALPLAGRALEVLREMSKIRRLDTDLVFASRRGKAGFPRGAWVAARRAAEIQDFRFHDLRHSAASYLAMNGATLAELAEILGHKTLSMVKRYSHLTEQHTSKVVARMNEAIFGSRDG